MSCFADDIGRSQFNFSYQIIRRAYDQAHRKEVQLPPLPKDVSLLVLFKRLHLSIKNYTIINKH